jgi:sterol desaturase/sphingolipid hydroxylase (fatty acid hydroxylase superfamily)
MQGLGVVFIIKLIDIRVLLLWAFMYATVHNINYLYVKPTTHKDHHVNHHTNYGLDFVDILLNTKYDYNDVEQHNHAAINLILITYVICYFTE